MHFEHIAIVLWMGLITIFQKNAIRWEYSKFYKDKVQRVSPIFAIITAIPFVWMVAVREDGFGDTAGYRRSFLTRVPDSFSDLSSYLETVTKDKGYAVVEVAIKSIFGNDDVLYFAILAIFQIGALIYIYRKFSEDFAMSMTLFVLSADYIGWMYNGIRQFTAVTLILYATPLLIKRRIVPVVLIILLASTLHQSALIMIPMFIIATGKPFNKRTVLLIIALVFSILFIGQFGGLLDSALQGTQYSGEMDAVLSETGDNGTNPLRALFHSIPALIAIKKRREIQLKEDKAISFFVNTSIITAAFYILSVFTSGVLMGRIPIYVSLFNYILLPWEVKELLSEKSKKIVVAAFLFFYLVQLHFGWNMI